MSTSRWKWFGLGGAALCAVCALSWGVTSGYGHTYNRGQDNPEGDPSPHYQHLQKLAPFEGVWKATISVGDGDQKPSVAIANYRWKVNHGILVYELDARDGDGNRILSHHAVISWDPVKQQVVSQGHRHNGERWDAVLTPQDQDRQWVSEFQQVDADGVKMKGKAIKVWKAPDTYEESVVQMVKDNGEVLQDLPPLVFQRQRDQP